LPLVSQLDKDKRRRLFLLGIAESHPVPTRRRACLNTGIRWSSWMIQCSGDCPVHRLTSAQDCHLQRVTISDAALDKIRSPEDEQRTARNMYRILTHCGRVTQICILNTVKLGTSASSP